MWLFLFVVEFPNRVHHLWELFTFCVFFSITFSLFFLFIMGISPYFFNSVEDERKTYNQAGEEVDFQDYG